MEKIRIRLFSAMLLFVTAILPACKAMGRADVQVSGVYPVVQDSWEDNPSFIQSAPFFDDTRILDIHFSMSPSAYKSILKARYKEGREQVYALATEMRIGDMVVSNVGLRGRGQTSFYKLNVKLSFDSPLLYDDTDQALPFPANKDRLVWGVAKLNLRASANDPTLLREQMATRVFQEARAYSSRMGFARVYVNGKYWGLYNTVEQMDEHFLEARFKKKSGQLYKGGYPSKMLPNFGNIFVIKTKAKTAEKDQVNQFFLALAQARTKQDLKAILDIESVLNYLAAATLTGHWDSFVFNPNNDYIYRHSSGKWYIMAWDLDNTFGSGIGWGFPVLNTSVFKMADNDNYRALFDKVLAIPEWKQAYIAKVRYLMQNSFHPVKFKKQVDVYKKLIKDAVYTDTYKKGDWRGVKTLEDSNMVWEQSFTQTPDMWNSQGFNGYGGGLLGWQSERWQSINDDLSGN